MTAELDLITTELNEKTQSESKLLSKVETQTKDYSMLSDAFYRLKREKEQYDLESKEHISSLEDKVKTQSQEISSSQVDHSIAVNKCKELQKQVSTLKQEKRQLSDKLSHEAKDKSRSLQLATNHQS